MQYELEELDDEELKVLMDECKELLQDRAADAFSRQFDWERTAKNE